MPALFLSVFSLILEIFPEGSGGRTDMFFKIITKRRGVFEAAGQGDFCNGIVCRTEHLGCHTKAVPEEILFWRGIFMVYKNFIKICPVDSHMSCYIRNPDVIAVVMFYIFFGGFKIFIGEVSAFYQNRILHERKEQEKIAQRFQLPPVGFSERSQQPLHT